MTNKLTSTAVMNRNGLGPDSLGFFPTPPWATRAFLDWLQRRVEHLDRQTCWEPCAGEGHMVLPLREVFADVVGTDIHDYGKGFGVADATKRDSLPKVDWVMTNPPFTLAEEIAQMVLAHSWTPSLALLCRLNWAESNERYERLFGKLRPTFIVQYAERVPMIAGAWDPEAGSATAYAWFVWLRGRGFNHTEFDWIRSGACRRFSKAEDGTLATPGEAKRRLAAKKAIEAPQTIDLFGDLS